MTTAAALQVLILPPVRRGSGAAEAVWGALLAHQVRRELRVILPQDGPETRRLCGLVRAVQTPEVLRIETEQPLPDLIRTADATVLTPLSPVGACEQATLSAGIAPGRLILTDTPAMRRAVNTFADRIHWCAHPTPREIARQILRVLETASSSPLA